MVVGTKAGQVSADASLLPAHDPPCVKNQTTTRTSRQLRRERKAHDSCLVASGHITEIDFGRVTSRVNCRSPGSEVFGKNPGFNLFPRVGGWRPTFEPGLSELANPGFLHAGRQGKTPGSRCEIWTFEISFITPSACFFNRYQFPPPFLTSNPSLRAPGSEVLPSLPPG